MQVSFSFRSPLLQQRPASPTTSGARASSPSITDTSPQKAPQWIRRPAGVSFAVSVVGVWEASLCAHERSSEDLFYCFCLRSCPILPLKQTVTPASLSTPLPIFHPAYCASYVEKELIALDLLDMENSLAVYLGFL
jgi:hypothetical protein